MLPRILVVDDDHYTRTLFKRLLGKSAELSLAADGAEARRLFAAGDFNLVLMDQRLPGENGIDLTREFRVQRPKVVTILMTGFADVRDAVAAVREGLFDYLTKPFDDLDALEAVIGKALELDAAYREIDGLRTRLATELCVPEAIGRSAAMERLLDQVRQVAGLDTTVLLEGESGTGKDVVARLLHAWSVRSAKPFLEVNCGGLPESLLESLLFGHEKGAFTGAAQASPGYFERAHGGNLFLDEIADMSPKLQSSLLHVLQSHQFTRIGSTQPRNTDFRLICATNRQLSGEVQAGRFREDLFYRINVVALRVPALRERQGDIILLAAHFSIFSTPSLARAAGRSPRPPCTCSKPARGPATCASSSIASSVRWRFMSEAQSTPRTCLPPASPSRTHGSSLRRGERPHCATRMLVPISSAIFSGACSMRRGQHIRGGASERHPAAESLCTHQALGNCH
jgi:two-component system response regulator AtoC